MATKTFKVSLSLDNPQLIHSGIDVRSFDKQSIKITIELTKDSQVYPIPADSQIKISLLKSARKQQKIILDVPFTTPEAIEWIVPDNLDGYQGEVRVGVYLIVGAENIDVGYFNIVSNVSDIDKETEEFTDNVIQGWGQIEADLAEIRATITQVNTLVSDFTDDVANKYDAFITNVNDTADAFTDDVTTKYNAFDETVTQTKTSFNDTVDAFTADVTTKQSDIASKHDAFDTQVIQAGNTIDDTIDSFTGDVGSKYNEFDTHVTQAKNNVDDTVDSFTAEVGIKHNEFDASVTQAEQTVNNTADAFTADVTSKHNEFDTHVTQVEQTVNDTVDAFTADVATKQSDVTSKYDAFYASVTQAGTTIEDILTRNEMNMYYDSQLGEYVNIEWFYLSQKTGKVYTSEFYNYSVSPSSTGVKKDANAGLVAEPSTNEFAGRDDYMDIALFKPLDVNGYVDDNDDYHVTAIKGDGRFRSDGTNGDVWVMNMTGFMKRFETETTWGYSYTDVQHPGFTVVPGGKKIDGTIRPFILRAKYPAVRNPHDDNKLASISGQNPEYVNMSYEGQITEFQKKGAQYSAKTTHDDFWVKLMLMLKYASTNSDTVGKGCGDYFGQYTPTILETGKSRFVVDNGRVAYLRVGSRVSIGDFGGVTPTLDRRNELVHNVRNRVTITGIEPLEDGVNSAVYLDTTPFDVTSTMRMTAMPWGSGACDAVKGVDGSPINGQSNKEPLLINGIEMMHGGYEVLQNVLIYNDRSNPDNHENKVFICYDCTKYATTVTEDYKLLSGRLPTVMNSTTYIATCEVDPQHPSLMVPSVVGASSSTAFGDTMYTGAGGFDRNLAWRSLGYLFDKLSAGFWFLSASKLSESDWRTFGRLSATGRSMGE